MALLAAAAAAIGGLALVTLTRTEPRLDLTSRPQTIFATLPLEVGNAYTIGSITIPADVPRPLTVTSVKVIARSGIEVVGVAAAPEGPSMIGLLAGWPVAGSRYKDVESGRLAYTGPIEIVVGVRTTAPRSGMRGVEVTWIDARGATGSRVYDIAAATCAPATCTLPEDDIDSFLRNLGLER